MFNKKLINELDQVDKDDLYNGLKNCYYLDMLITETLRKYPAIAALSRCCVKEFKVPGRDLLIQPGDDIMINVAAIHYNPNLYPEPYKWDPERFSKLNENNRHGYVISAVQL